MPEPPPADDQPIKRGPPRHARSLSEMASDGNGAGIICPACHCRQFATPNTWAVHGGIRRTRRCRNCGTEIVTIETGGTHQP